MWLPEKNDEIILKVKDVFGEFELEAKKKGAEFPFPSTWSNQWGKRENSPKR